MIDGLWCPISRRLWVPFCRDKVAMAFQPHAVWPRLGLCATTLSTTRNAVCSVPAPALRPPLVAACLCQLGTRRLWAAGPLLRSGPHGNQLRGWFLSHVGGGGEFISFLHSLAQESALSLKVNIRPLFRMLLFVLFVFTI